MRQTHRRRMWVQAAAGVVIVALVATVATLVSGFDAQDTPREDPSIWVARADGQYARVNTETAEIDTVRIVENPSTVVQTGGLSLLLTQGLGQAWEINTAHPRDIQEARGATANGDATPVGAEAVAEGVIRTPDGTRQVLAAGGSVVFHTDAGEVFVAAAHPGEGFASARLGSLTQLDPRGGEAAQTPGDAADDSADEFGADTARSYIASAVAIDENGLVALFSASEQSVRWYSTQLREFVADVSEVPAEVPAQEAQLAIVSGEWVLFDAASGTVWLQNGATATIDPVGEALLQASSDVQVSISGAGAGNSAAQDSETLTGGVLIADEAGLWHVSTEGASERIAEASGAPAKPRVSTAQVAAWVGAGTASMWTATEGIQTLEFDGAVDEITDPMPEIRTSGTRALLTETQTGMLWTVPDGTLIPIEQWALMDPPREAEGEVVAQDVTEPEPPVAVNDQFGVRAGEPTLLPVLLNDYDPNRKDVLTIVGDGLGEDLPAEFGTISLLSDAQNIALHPDIDAAGSATFTYRITDGVSVSEPASVTLTVADETVNSAPQWCPAIGCQRAWPSPEMSPGGTLVLPLLEGWVDPEGDPMMIASASVVNPADPAHALVTDDGRVAVRHTDAFAGEGEIAVSVRVEDSRGAATEEELRIRVRAGAVFEISSMAATVTVGEETTIRPLQRVTGGSGSFRLVDAAVQQGNVVLTVNQGTGAIGVTAQTAGSTLLTVTVRDTVTEQETSNTVRITAIPSHGSFGVPPLRAFVRPLADTTIDVLSAIPGANTRALTVQAATVHDGQLRADVFEHSSIRLSGSTPDGNPGRIGAVDLVVREGDVTASGRLTVFQVADTSAGGAIAVADTATVRAGSVVDIAVLDNDVAPAGERLVLHPEVSAPGEPGELAFASGSRVRYLAPETAGTYTLSYTMYGASSPERSDVGRVQVTVLPAGANRDPQPATVTVRVAPGERANAVIPLSNVDPDGDRVRLVSVGQTEDAQIAASIVSRTNAISVEASSRAATATHLVPYTVRDSFGGEAEGTLRIIVTDAEPGGGAPVAYSDYVRLTQAATAPAVVRPLDNDIDPAGGVLDIVSIEPNVPGGEESPLFTQLNARLDTSALDQGIVKIAAGDELGTVSFRYTVQSSETTSTSDGLIVVQVSERIGLQAPAITDTVLTVRDRADFESVGVDVVTDRVRWAAGDIAGLELSLWGDAADTYAISGSSHITGSYRAEGDLVPFRLAGLDATGAEVESFGFLIVPPLDELRLSFRADLDLIFVDEEEQIEVDVRNLLDLGPADTLVLEQGRLQTQRAQAACETVGSTSIRYSSGREAPWADSCTIRVRLAEQTTFTTLAVPFTIVPDEPVVQLEPLTRTIAPGQSETIDLADMTAWQGGREGDFGALVWQVTPPNSAFDVVASGSILQVTAHADAVPGSQQVAAVNVSGVGESDAPLTLRVGEAAIDAPRGATIALQCVVGTDCRVNAIGQPGEYDPFVGAPGAGLELVSVEAASCTYGSLRVTGSSVEVGWPAADGPGGRCTATFTVRDAQDRTGTGTIELDAHGVPRAPGGIELVAFSANSVTFDVLLGEAASAHPETTGVIIQRDGAGAALGECVPSGASYRCTVGNLTVGDQRNYTARAVNAVGESSATGAVTAWAYEAPAAPTSTDVEQVSAESTSSGTARFVITTSDSTTDSFSISAASVTRTVEVPASGSVSVELAGLPVGEVPWEITPVSRYAPPMGDVGNLGNRVNGVIEIGGLPSLGAPIVVSEAGSDEFDLTVVAGANGGSDLEYGARMTGNCFGSLQENPEFTFSASAHTEVEVRVCARNEWGSVGPETITVLVGGEVPMLTGFSYEIGIDPLITAGVDARYTLVATPNPTPLTGYQVQYRTNQSDATISTAFPSFSADEAYTMIEVRQRQGQTASDWAVVEWIGAPTVVNVDLGTCVTDPANTAELLERISLAARDFATATHDETMLHVSWNGQFAALEPLNVDLAMCDGGDGTGGDGGDGDGTGGDGGGGEVGNREEEGTEG